MTYFLTKLWFKIFLWFYDSGSVIPTNKIVGAPFSTHNIARALTFSKQGKLKYKVKLPDGTIPNTIWNDPRDIPSTIDGASDVIPVFVKN